MDMNNFTYLSNFTIREVFGQILLNEVGSTLLVELAHLAYIKLLKGTIHPKIKSPLCCLFVFFVFVFVFFFNLQCC